MPRSEREERQREKFKYTNARAMAEKASSGLKSNFLKLPGEVKIYRPKAGTALLDIIPFVAGENNPEAQPGDVHWERTYYVHRNVGPNQEMVLCLAKNYDKPCPICEERAALLNEEDEDTEDLRKSLRPAQRQMVNVINLKEPDKGIQLMDLSYHAFGKVLMERISGSEEDDNWELFFTLEDGLTLRVVWDEESFGKGRSFLKAQNIDFKSRSKSYSSRDMDDALVLDDLFVEPSYKELKAMFVQAPSSRDTEDRDSGSRRRGDREEEQEDERPERGSRRSSREEDEEPPRRSRRDREEDQQDEEPKRSTRREEAEDEAPPKRSRRGEEEEKDSFDEGRNGRGGRRGEKEERAPSSRDKEEWGDFDDDKGSKDKDKDEEPSSRRRREREEETEEREERSSRRERARSSRED